MNRVEIRYTFFSNKPDIKINGEAASPYSEVVAALNHAFLDSFPSVIPSLDREIYDDYEIYLFASEIQCKLLETTIGESEFCKAIHCCAVESLFTPDDMATRLSAICSQNSIDIPEQPRISIYNSSPVSIAVPEGFLFTDVPKADIGIFVDPQDIPTTVRNPVILSGPLSMKDSRARRLLYVPESDIESFLAFYRTEYYLRPIISECLIALRYAKLNNRQKVEFSAIKNNAPAYYLSELPSALDNGDSAAFQFSCFPTESFSFRSADPTIISITGSALVARGAGTANLVVTDSDDAIVLSKAITVVQHHYIEEIRLIPRFDYLKRSEKNRIDIITTPQNAEDSGEISWEVSDPSIIQIDRTGNVIALQPGSCELTVSARYTSASVLIEVKPALEGLRITQQAIRLKSGTTTIIDCEVSPPDAPTDTLVWELDNKTIAYINPSKTGRRCQVVASTGYEGSGNIRCYDSKSKLGAICNLEVFSRVLPTGAGKAALWCWLLGIIIPFLLPISTIASIYGLSQDPEPERRTRYIVCAIGSVLTLIFWLSIAMS